MRLYNAQSCTPMATATLRPAPSFPPQGFLPTSWNGNRRTIRITRRDMKQAILDRYQPSRREGRDDQATREDCREGSEEREYSAPFRSPEQRETFVPSQKQVPGKREMPSKGLPGGHAESEFEPIPETTPLLDREDPAGTCFPAFPKKVTAVKAKKRNSAFHSPLRIAKYSFQSPPPRSQRTLSTDSTLDLVFSPDDSPQISKNETGTTAATSEIGPTQSDSSSSFLFDIEVVKSDSETPARMLETGSVISKSSSSTLTTNFAALRREARHREEKPFDELAVDRHEDTRSLSSPVHWDPMEHEDEKPAPVKVEKKKVSTTDPLWPEALSRSDIQKKSVFETAWIQAKFNSEDGFSESGSWIDFTNDPFKSHTSSALQRPCPAKSHQPTKVTTNNTAMTQPMDADGFILAKIPEKRTMESYASRVSDAGASVISFPSITTGGNTWSQADSMDERDTEPRTAWARMPLRAPSVTPASTALHKGSSHLLGSILQARFEANRKARQSNSKAPMAAAKLVPKQSMHIAARTKPPVRPTVPIAKSGPSTQVDDSEKNSDQHAPSIEIAKYVKMLGMGIPAGAVKTAMARDGVDVSLLFRSEMSPAIHAETFTSTSDKSVRHFRIHWRVRPEAGANTLWSKVNRDVAWVRETIRVDEGEFAALFRQQETTKTSPLNKKKSVGASLVRVIDPKRANNGGIALSQIKLSYEHTAQAVDRMDCTVLSMDQMKAILPYVPSSEEATKLRQSLRSAASSDWFRCECEKFMVAMLRVTEAEEKLQNMIFMNGFEDLMENLKKDAMLIQRACQEVMSSHNFRRVIASLLDLGNKVNREASCDSVSRARAITLDSLVILNQSKAFDRQTTFLQYVATLLRKYSPEVLDWKQEDMPSLRRAHKVKWNLWQAEVDLMGARLSSLRSRCLQTSAITKSGDGVSSTPATAARLSNPIWTFVCQAEVKLAALKEQGDKGSHALECLWQYFGESCSTPSRFDSVLGTLVLFGHQWEQAVEHAVRREREGRRKPKEWSSSDPPIAQPESVSPASSKASQHSPFLTSSQSYGHDV